MAFHDDLATIESRQFSAELNVVSSTEAFYRVLSRNPVVVRVLDELRASGELLEELAGRVLDLCAVSTDPRYENPYDAALAAYLWLAHYSSEGLTRSLATTVDGTSRTWYAKKLAFRILSQHRLLVSGTWPPPPEQARLRYDATEQQINIALDSSWLGLIRKIEIRAPLASQVKSN